jgi:hypothetical protein
LWVHGQKLSDDCYENQKWKGNFHSNTAFLFYDRASRVVYFYTQGID